MKVKKYKHADLERKRSVFFQVGLIIALGASLAAFEWGSSSKSIELPVFDDPYTEVEDMAPLVKMEEPKKELPKPKMLIDLILVDDKTVILEDPIVFESEDLGEPVVIPDMIEEDEVTMGTFHRVEKMPVFPGGESALLKYIAANVRYPTICAEAGVTGKVYISFVVDETGKVVEVGVARSPDANLSAEAMRVVNAMPNWTPGRQRDKNVRVAFTIPVNFVLE
ncbi:energy transducer TonB [Carboxylicivirga sp. M1479]|uniref:energy transducer TonB n=1 Tax=Carboxylicivirga sp. M1479 TaxID=2594476 RepID=UPI001177AE7A|nr:energy transducer TonB [Carboxylicivirga sp. M1479]TRX71109.1 energy transducer TonB [Carboxylicivirga sp. M1479]